MADLAVVALGIDTSALKRGEVQAVSSLKNIEAEMAKAEQAGSRLGSDLSKSVQKTEQSFSGLNRSSTSLTQSLSQMGGPLGQAAGRFESLAGQVGGLSSQFGVLGTVALGAVAGVVALGGALANMAIAGAKTVDEMGDIAQATGLTFDQVQKLATAFRLSGEDLGSVEASFRSFSRTVGEALQDSTGEAAQRLKALGVSATEAGQDMGAAFTGTVARLGELRSTVEGTNATNELFGRSIGNLVRSSEELNNVLGLSHEELVSMGLAASTAQGGADALDQATNNLSTSMTVLKETMADVIGNDIAGFFNAMSAAVQTASVAVNGLDRVLQGMLGTLSNSRLGAFLALIAKVGITGATGGLFSGAAGDNDTFNMPATGFVGGGRTGGGGGGGRVARAVAREAEPRFTALPHMISALEIQKNLAKASADFAASMEELRQAEEERQEAAARFNELITQTGKFPLAIGGAPPIAEGGIPGVVLPEPFDPTRDSKKQQIDQAFEAIFDDAVIALLRGQTTFSGALIGVIDGVFFVFAEEFARSMRESFVDPLIRQLTDYLTDALNELFGNFSGKGIGGFFTSLLKSIGGFFGGFFATGGTLGPHQFGVVGERGPEFVFSGNAPMTITPTAQMAGGPVSINFMVTPDATGGISRRTQDQIADGVLRGLQQSQKLRGAR